YTKCTRHDLSSPPDLDRPLRRTTRRPLLDVRPDSARLNVKPSRPRVNRRDLLRLRKAARALREPSGASSVEERSVSSTDLLRASRPAMGSYFEVRLGATVPGAADLAGRALDLIEALEFQMTVYRDDSEVSRLNASAHLGPVEVEAGLFGLLRR